MLLPTLLQDWRLKLTGWAADGTLSSAAREALQLSDEPPELSALIGQWAAADFSALPPIEVLDVSVLPGAAGAYAISTGMIYLNGDWLALASIDRVIAIFPEELRRGIDWLAHAIHRSVYPLRSHWACHVSPRGIYLPRNLSCFSKDFENKADADKIRILYFGAKQVIRGNHP